MTGNRGLTICLEGTITHFPKKPSFSPGRKGDRGLAWITQPGMGKVSTGAGRPGFP